MSTIRYAVVEVDRADVATMIGNVNDPSEAPPTTVETTVYVLKQYLFAPVEVWIRDAGGDFHKVANGEPLTHWSSN